VGDAALRQQLEQQKKAYDELRKKVEMLQSAQDEDDSQVMTGGSGYAEFPMREIEAPPLSDGAVEESKIRDQVRRQPHKYSVQCLFMYTIVLFHTLLYIISISYIIFCKWYFDRFDL